MRRTALLLLGAAATCLIGASGIPKKIKPAANPPRYKAFAQPLAGDLKTRHALERLTFGPRPDDATQLEKMGLNEWLDRQLHPERVIENSVLLAKLAPYESLKMSVRETYLHYPAPQLIAAVARGKAPPPDDPELHDLVIRLANRYLARHAASADTQAAGAADANELGDLDLRKNIRDFLTRDQIQVLRNGKPEEKRNILATIPEGEYLDFAWAVPPGQRRQLIAFAPVELRRTFMMITNPRELVATDLTESKLLRAIYSNHQLTELLDDFWFNHFNVFVGKGGERYLVPSYERDVIRPHIFGHFYDLLVATAESPAMLFYLDNAESVAPNSPAGHRSKRGLNENYGRELLELHTLGVDGGYTQKDVIEVARCFTGWTISAPRQGSLFEYKDNMHDKGEKIVLGHKIKAGRGMEDGLELLKILSESRVTAHHISLLMAQRFVADDPPPSLLNRMADTFLRTHGDLREVTRVMIESPEFWSQGAYEAKVKSPFEMLVSAVRASNAQVDSALALAHELNKLGEPLYRKIEPTGYKSANSEWVSSAALLDRMNFSLALTHNRVPGIQVNLNSWNVVAEQDPFSIARALLDQDPSGATRSAIQKMLDDPQLQKQLATNASAGPPLLPSLIAGLSLGSPEFQRR